jgi:amidase
MTGEIKDTANAFVSTFTVPGAASGPLAGLTFGAKDLYDIAGHMTGCGNPDWARTHGPASVTAPSVLKLLDAGATLVGKTHTDEIAYSLMGVNAHYGTPVNSAAPDRVPGGSSSGSVAATAAGLVDFGLGSDTGGSVRMPASFCGVYGIRTTLGKIGLDDVMALAPSFDTAGWFARDPDIMARVGEAYGMDVPADPPKVRLLAATDMMKLATPETRDALQPAIRQVNDIFGTAKSVRLAEGDISGWREVFRVCQAAEVWQVHGDWVTREKPSFGPGVLDRFRMASSITEEELTPARREREAIRERVTDLLGDDGIIVLPTSPGPAPLRNASEADLDRFRVAALELLCTAGLCGLPQISLPVARVDGAPVGLSLIGGACKDGLLLSLARKFARGRISV